MKQFKKNLFLMLICTVVLTSCKSEEYQKQVETFSSVEGTTSVTEEITSVSESLSVEEVILASETTSTEEETFSITDEITSVSESLSVEEVQKPEICFYDEFSSPFYDKVHDLHDPRSENCVWNALQESVFNVGDYDYYLARGTFLSLYNLTTEQEYELSGSDPTFQSLVYVDNNVYFVNITEHYLRTGMTIIDLTNNNAYETEWYEYVDESEEHFNDNMKYYMSLESAEIIWS